MSSYHAGLSFMSSVHILSIYQLSKLILAGIPMGGVDQERWGLC